MGAMGDMIYKENAMLKMGLMDLRAEIVTTFSDFRIAWNKVAGLLTSLLEECPTSEYRYFIVEKITRDIEIHSVGDCLTEISGVVERTGKIFNKIMFDLCLEDGIDNIWEGVEIKANDIGEFKGIAISRAFLFLFHAVWSSFAAPAVTKLIVITATGWIKAFANIGRWIFGFVIGAVFYSVGDILSEVVVGAYEKTQLKKQMGVLRPFVEDIKPKFQVATVNLMGIAQRIKEGSYRIDDNTIILKYKGKFKILKINKGKKV
ncbi:MAG: hypothetical protein ACRCSG_07365 [Cellulosilyticaceae bacterium]